MDWTSFFIEQFATPGKLVGHLSYVLLVASMMMRSMKWLRMIAISAGVVSAFYGYFFLRDFVTVFWEVVFVSVNLIQLMILEFANRRARFSEDEQKFIKAAIPRVERAHARRLLRLAKHTEYQYGEFLSTEGVPIDKLHFILEGAVRIDKEGSMVGVCGHDDFIGEIGFLMDGMATATAVVTHSVRCFTFDYDQLEAYLVKDPDMRQALESSFNRNLVGKLVKSNEVTGGSDTLNTVNLQKISN